ncbi:MAG TPA: potassium channel protein [Archangium sp.]|uniref:potassium channel family protein n=1 Tax=Archangium sp. TaxID=1872627 RepID=UPI002E347C4D|nr:potassium channel protein [Archangium sp.]HEX5752712.1 potassium channel protein [Archangium sp.]
MARQDELRSLRIRVLIPLTAICIAGLGGTVGFYVLWREQGGTWLDALYMTFNTLATVGFKEVRPLDAAGRWLTMAVGVTGIGGAFFLFSVVMDYLVTQRFLDVRGRRRMQNRIDALSGHYVVAGLGRVGRRAAEELREAKAAVVVVDPSEEVEALAGERDYLHLQGDATEDEVLERAGIRRAKGLIVTTNNDATNLYVVLSARILNPNLFIVARADEEDSVPKLMRAGADRAMSPYAIGGRRLAHLMLSPGAVEFFETAMRRGNQALNIGEIVLVSGSRMVGRPLAELSQETGATLLAVLRDNTAIAAPKPDLVLATGDRLLALGTDEQLERLEKMLLAPR